MLESLRILATGLWDINTTPSKVHLSMAKSMQYWHCHQAATHNANQYIQ